MVAVNNTKVVSFFLEADADFVGSPDISNPTVKAFGEPSNNIFADSPPEAAADGCVTFLAGTEHYESMINLCFTTPATYILTKFVPNKLNTYLRYATVALST